MASYCFSNGRTQDCHHACTSLVCRFSKCVLPRFPLLLWDRALLPCLLPFPPHCFLLFCLKSVLISCILKARLPPTLPPPQAVALPFCSPWLPKPFKASLSWPPAASHHPLLSYRTPSQSIAVLVPSEGACDPLLPNPAGCLSALHPGGLWSIWPCSSPPLLLTIPIQHFLSFPVPLFSSHKCWLSSRRCPPASCFLSSLLGDHKLRPLPLGPLCRCMPPPVRSREQVPLGSRGLLLAGQLPLMALSGPKAPNVQNENYYFSFLLLYFY